MVAFDMSRYMHGGTLWRPLNQDAGNLSELLKATFGISSKEVLCEGQVLEGKISAGSPAVLIISTSALRSLELLRFLISSLLGLLQLLELLIYVYILIYKYQLPLVAKFSNMSLGVHLLCEVMPVFHLIFIWMMQLLLPCFGVVIYCLKRTWI